MGGGDTLTPHERDEIVRAIRAGRDLTKPVAVTYFFSTQGSKPIEAEVALKEYGVNRVIIDEEISGDGYWHIAAFTGVQLTAPAIGYVNKEMESIAAKTRVKYDGWKVTFTVGECTT